MLANIVLEVGGLSVFLFAGVSWLKQLGVKGKWLTLCAFLFGLIFGVCMRYASAPLVSFADWFWAVAFGLLAGFLATGAYKGSEFVLKTDDKSLAGAKVFEAKQTTTVVAAIQTPIYAVQKPNPNGDPDGSR